MTPGWTVDDEVLVVDLEDPVHARQRDGQPALDPGRTARQAGSRATRHDRDAETRGEPDDVAHLCGVRGQRDRQRQPRVQVRRLVLAVRLAIGRVGQQADVRQLGPERREESPSGLRVDRCVDGSRVCHWRGPECGSDGFHGPQYARLAASGARPTRRLSVRPAVGRRTTTRAGRARRPAAA